MIPVEITLWDSNELDENGFKGHRPSKIEFPKELLCKPDIGDYVPGFLPDGTIDIDSFIVTGVHHSFDALDQPIIEIFVRWCNIESKNYISAIEEIKKLKEELEDKNEEINDLMFSNTHLKGELIEEMGVIKAKEVWNKILEEKKANGQTPDDDQDPPEGSAA